MGEKGVAADAAAAIGGPGTVGMVERTTTKVTESVVGVVTETGDSIRSKLIDTAADNAIDEGRQRLHKNELPDNPTT